jgi:hypothetical protein
MGAWCGVYKVDVNWIFLKLASIDTEAEVLLPI